MNLYVCVSDMVQLKLHSFHGLDLVVEYQWLFTKIIHEQLNNETRIIVLNLCIGMSN